MSEVRATAVQPRPRVREDEFTAEHQVYEPHAARFPPLGPYARALWERRQFAWELARTNLRAEHFNTVLGQLWLVMNPLLLAFVYFALVEIVGRGDRDIVFLAHLMFALFAFRLVSRSVNRGAKSIVGGGRLILNTAFPRMVLPLTAVLTAVITFLPTLAVYAVVHGIADRPVGPNLLWAIPILAVMTVFGAGAAMIVATAQVYFRDLANFLPYATRIWLYTSPILYYTHEVPDRFEPILAANPLYPMLGSLSDVVDQGGTPSVTWFLWGLAWAVGTFVVGALFFVSREREFAIRL
jgi:ABC-type polysaccharide/polyol phosphate export permease